MIKIDTERVYSLRPNEYDADVLEKISRAHPEIPDVAGLIRKALREYQIAREDGGGMKAKTTEALEATRRIELTLGYLVRNVDFLVANAEKCESIGD